MRKIVVDINCDGKYCCLCRMLQMGIHGKMFCLAYDSGNQSLILEETEDEWLRCQQCLTREAQESK